MIAIQADHLYLNDCFTRPRKVREGQQAVRKGGEGKY